jgi:adenylate kinase
MMNTNKKTNSREPSKDRKIFLNNMNSWFSNFVIEALRTETVTDPKITKNEFMGTRNNSKMKLPHLFKPTEITIDYNFHYEHEIFTNDFFIYNMEDSDYKEIEYIIKGLKTLKHSSEKVLIIISSIMTWARTPPKVKKEKVEGEGAEGDQPPAEEESEPEEAVEEEVEAPAEGQAEGSEEVKEPPKKYLPFKDKDYIVRIPSKKYYNYKMIETLALSASNTNPMLKTYIICPGFIYGCGEEMFYDYFKMAWLTEPNKLPIIGDGKNSIPTIHILDLVSLIKRIIEKKPNIKYIFAVDKTKNRSLKNIITGISKACGTGLAENILDFSNENTTLNIPSYNELSINVKCKTSKVFSDKKEENEEEEDFLKRCFKWHCEFGISENLEKLRKEFTTYRNLKSIKIMVTGAPAAGKSSLAESLSKFYNLPHIKVSDLVESVNNLPADDKLCEEIKAKLEEEKDKMLEAYEEAQKKNKNKKKGDPVPDRNSFHPRIPDEFLVQLLKRKLKDNLCRNRGYILDGYPRHFNDANLIFYEIDTEKAEDDPTRQVLIEEIIPNSIIKLDGDSDEYLKNRVKSLPETMLVNTHYNEEGMNRRLQTYRHLNESAKGDLSLCDFFKKINVDILNIDCKINENEVLNRAKIFLERNGTITNFQKFDEIEEKSHKEKFEQKIEVDVSKEEIEQKE